MKYKIPIILSSLLLSATAQANLNDQEFKLKCYMNPYIPTSTIRIDKADNIVTVETYFNLESELNSTMTSIDASLQAASANGEITDAQVPILKNEKVPDLNILMATHGIVGEYEIYHADASNLIVNNAPRGFYHLKPNENAAGIDESMASTFQDTLGYKSTDAFFELTDSGQNSFKASIVCGQLQ